MDSYLFIKGYDSMEGDVKRVNLKEHIPEEFFNLPCFNTLGFFKHTINQLKTSPYFKENDGLYVKNIIDNFPIKVVNLDRRPDRWEQSKKRLDEQGIKNYERFSAIDGTKLEMTQDIKYLFRNNDFNYRQGFVGCALSHLKLWNELIRDEKNDYYIIMEDDFELTDDFKNKLNITLHQIIQKPFIDLHFLGYFYWSGEPEKNQAYPIMKMMDVKSYMGGFYGYIISKSAAFKMINISKYYGIQNGIDRFAHIHFDKMIVSHSEPHIVYSRCVVSGNNVDSDIQRNSNPVGINSLSDSLIFKPLNIMENSKYKVKILSNWCSSSDMIKNLGKFTENSKNKWKDMIITNSNEADYYVIINKPRIGDYYNPEKTILFQMEPWVYDETKTWGVKTWGKWSKPEEMNLYKILTHKYHPNLGEWHINKTYSELMCSSFKKSKEISTFISEKNYDEGHIKRIEFIKFLEEKESSEFSVDIYGRKNHGFKNYKGSPEFKDEGLIPYKYTICVENNSEHNYVTEKLYDGIVSECLCFYWGAPNIGDIIDEKAIIKINLDNFEETYETIKTAIQNNEWEKRLKFIKKEKVKILNKLQFMPSIYNAITSIKTPKKNNLTIGFLSNKLTLRGTEVAMYDYAHYNEQLLGNKSIIITRGYEDCKNEDGVSEAVYKKFSDRFPVFYYKNKKDIDEIVEKNKIDILYIIKYGTNDGLMSSKCKNFIHSVFDSRQKHGEIYSVISESVNEIFETNHPVFPHIVKVAETEENLRNELNIPKDSIVFGCYGGHDSFDIQYIIDTIEKVSKSDENSNIYFLFMNIKPFIENSGKIIFLKGTDDMMYKRKFINSCNAMIYGRSRGETFGLSCGEFSICNKPVIASISNVYEKFHIKTLKDNLITHSNEKELYEILTKWEKFNKDVTSNDYKNYTAEKVMEIFKSLI